MFKIRNALKKFTMMILIFSMMIIMIQYDPEFLVGGVAGLVSFFLLKIIYSDHLYFIFNKKRYALSFVRLMYTPLFIFRRFLGEKMGNILFSLFVPGVFVVFSGESWAFIFSLISVLLFYKKRAVKSDSKIS